METERLEKIKNEVKRIYSYGHYDGHLDRIAKTMAIMAEKHGDEVIELMQSIGDNLHEMIECYLKMTMKVLDTFKEKYGDNAVNGALTEHMEQVQTVTGRMMAEGRVLSLDEIVEKFNWADLVSKSEDSAVIRTKGCLESHIAYRLGFGDAMYYLYCSGDHKMIELMNPDYTCTFDRTYMQHGDCCEYNIHKKL
jgi:predicted ArsR family transcriptional regulator